MLSQFIVKNFKSIKDEMIFDMQAAAISEHKDRLIRTDNNENLLPVSVIYGPNGGGKSNVLKAIHTLVFKVLRPLYIAELDEQRRFYLNSKEIVPFAFSEDCKNAPTEFELFFRTSKAEYRYILHVMKEKIQYESLSMKKVDFSRVTDIFERDDGKIYMVGEFSKLTVSDDISDTLPLLSYLGMTYRKNEVIADCINWFEHGINFLNYANPVYEAILRRLTIANSANNATKELILNMIKEMDLDIEDFRVEKKDNESIRFFTSHRIDGKSYELDIEEESNGTRKLFGLLPLITNSITKGVTLVIDELDANIHPILLKHIIMLYNNIEINKHGAQLIFTSHDLSTMNRDVFRRDEIWFVAKGREQNSKLYSLVEFKNTDGKSVRKDATFDKQYLEGKYGADPYLKKIIDWSVIK
jgi:AAA15 family ATPase/GTPase